MDFINNNNIEKNSTSEVNENDENEFTGKFLHKKRKYSVKMNSKYFYMEEDIENKKTVKDRIVIPLKLIIGAQICCCTISDKRLFCKCLCDESSSVSSPTSSVSSTSSATRFNSSSSSSSSASKYSSSGEYSNDGNPALTKARLYYVLPVRKYKLNVYSIVLRSLSNSKDSFKIINEFVNNLRNLLNDFNRPKRFLIFVNPYGGKRKAPSIYKTNVEPLLKVACCDYDMVVTQRANHARDVIENLDFSLKQYSGIICVGGDGMFTELLNGVMIRTQLEANVKYPSPDSILKKPSIPIGVVPAGSTDATAFAVTGINDPITSTIQIILGNRISLDVCGVYSNSDDSHLLRYAISFLGYGYFGDLLKDSDNNRWMGPWRYDWAGLKKILKNRSYNGELKLQVSTLHGSPKDDQLCEMDCSLCRNAAIINETNCETMTTDTEVDKKIYDEKSQIAIRGRFLAINAASLSCRCNLTKKGISPSAHVGNGCTDLIIVSNCSIFNYLRYLIRTGFVEKSPFNLSFVNVYRVKEFEFTPIINSRSGNKATSYSLSNASVWNCDGEVIAEPSIRVKVFCQMVTVFGSGIVNREKRKPSVVIPDAMP